MSDRTNHRRVLHFAVTGVLLGGAVGCTSNEPAKGDGKTDAKGPSGRTIVNQDPVDPPEPKPEDVKFAPNPGPNELEGKQPEPIVAPTTAVKDPPPPPEPVEEDHVNEGPVKEPPKEPVPVGINEGPQPDPKPEPQPKRVNTGPVKAPAPIKVNPGPEG